MLFAKALHFVGLYCHVLSCAVLCVVDTKTDELAELCAFDDTRVSWYSPSCRFVFTFPKQTGSVCGRLSECIDIPLLLSFCSCHVISFQHCFIFSTQSVVNFSQAGMHHRCHFTRSDDMGGNHITSTGNKSYCVFRPAADNSLHIRTRRQDRATERIDINTDTARWQKTTAKCNLELAGVQMNEQMARKKNV
jgi:hypothetical protein